MNKISTLTSQWTAKWDDTESKGLILAFDEIFNAPQQAGLYAWYAVLGLGEMDILCENQTRTALRKQTKKYTPSPLSGEMRGNLGAKWSGQLFDKSMDNLSQVLSGREISNEESQQSGNGLDRALSNQDSRRLLISSLEACIPVFLSPLYVGISDNLNRRLSEHIRLFRLASRESRKEMIDDEYDNQDICDKNFAFRAVNSGFREDNLKAFILPFDNLENLSKQQIRDVVAATEFLVNRWAKPSLGER
jgi:hypothetical protein